MTGLRLYKAEKLCSLTAIETLFTKGSSRSVTTFPLRAVWRVSSREDGAPARFLISVPKKRLRHAVDRVATRRKVREAYRLNRNALLLPEATKVDVAFVFMGTSVPEYATVEAAMIKMLGKISSSLAALSDKNCGENTPDSSKETAS